MNPQSRRARSSSPPQSAADRQFLSTRRDPDSAKTGSNRSPDRRKAALRKIPASNRIPPVFQYGPCETPSPVQPRARRTLRESPGFDPPRRNFQQFAPRRMPVLPNQSHAPIAKQRQRAGASGMPDDIANDLDSVLFEQTVTFDIEHGSSEDFLRFQQLSRQIRILSQPRYSIMRLFKRARQARKTAWLFVLNSPRNSCICSRAVIKRPVRQQSLQQ